MKIKDALPMKQLSCNCVSVDASGRNTRCNARTVHKAADEYGSMVGSRQLMSMQGGSQDAVDTGAHPGLATCGPQHKFLKGPLRL